MKKEFFDKILGPILDRLGSKAVEKESFGNVFKFDLYDRETQEIVGQKITAVRDGWMEISTFTKPTSLRKKVCR